MPHVPLLEIRPELREQDEALDDPEDPETEQDTNHNNGQSTDEADAGEMETYTTFQNLAAKCAGAKCGVMQRVKRFIFRSRQEVGNNTGRIRSNDDSDDSESKYDTDEENGQSNDDSNAAEMEANTTIHDLEKYTDAKYGFVQRVKRFVSKINGGNNAADRTGLMTAESDSMCHSDDEID